MSGMLDRLYNTLFKDGNLWYQRTKTQITIGEVDVRPAGLEEGFDTHKETVTDTPVQLAAVSSFLNRKSISVLNEGPDYIYVHQDNTVSTNKWPVKPDAVFNVDFAAAIEVWAVCDTAETATVLILEMA